MQRAKCRQAMMLLVCVAGVLPSLDHVWFETSRVTCLIAGFRGDRMLLPRAWMSLLVTSA